MTAIKPARAASAPFRITGLDHVVLRVPDVDRALGFYCNVLGCSVERGPLPSGLIQLRAGASLIDLVRADIRPGQPNDGSSDMMHRNVDHICIGVRPFDETSLRAHLKAHDIEIVDSGINYGAEGNGPFVYLRDPAGNGVELKGPSIPRSTE